MAILNKDGHFFQLGEIEKYRWWTLNFVRAINNQATAV